MLSPLHALGLVLALFAMAAVVVQTMAALLLARFRRRPSRGLGWAPPVTVLLPPGGGDRGAALTALARQDYPGPVRLVTPAGGDAPTAASAGGLEVVAVPVAAAADGAALLDALARRAEGAVLVVAAPDMVVPRDWLSRMVAPLQSRSIALVACATRSRAADGSLPARLAALTADTRLLPATIMAPRAAWRRGLGREAMALRADDLASLGGFAALLAPATTPAEVVRERLGLRPYLATTLPERRIDRAPPPPLGPDLPFWHALPLALAVTPLLPQVGLVLTAAALLSRWLVAIAAGARDWPLLPLRDMLAPLSFVHRPARRSGAVPPAVPAE
ncbi:glycosyltransferase [Caenispirillum bisanense]|uniref:Glycosyl transferase family 21 n=1 Tax=Caenispirillum bisanense TaxID=414052 RepID=A0A286G615_9PROT|nr:glycosyltransferase [Caenispirillum bisanense]SOD90646.1 Glycosyl transferase family 21 [Caenispirillum bisanense]